MLGCYTLFFVFFLVLLSTTLFMFSLSASFLICFNFLISHIFSAVNFSWKVLFIYGQHKITQIGSIRSTRIPKGILFSIQSFIDVTVT